MDNVGQGGGGDGAFERFITSAIATILTIIFSWRLLLETEGVERQTRALPAPPLAAINTDYEDDNNNDRESLDDADKCQQSGEDNTGESEASGPGHTERSPPYLRPAPHDLPAEDLTMAERLFWEGSLPVGPRVGAVTMDASGFVLCSQTVRPASPAHQHAAERYYGKETMEDADRDTQTDSNGDDGQKNGDGKSHHHPRPHHHSQTMDGDSDNSTIENDSGGDDNSDDNSDSGTEKESSSDSSDYTGEAREYHLGEPLGDSSSESEYCLVFNYLEAITEEDSDDVETSDKEKHVPATRTKRLSESASARSHLNADDDDDNSSDSDDTPDGGALSSAFNITAEALGQDPDNHSHAEGDADQSKINPCKVAQSSGVLTQRRFDKGDSDSEATASDTGSIDVTYDGDVDSPREGTGTFELATSPTRGNLLNTQRPLIIGPYTDRHSKFARGGRCVLPATSGSGVPPDGDTLRNNQLHASSDVENNMPEGVATYLPSAGADACLGKNDQHQSLIGETYQSQPDHESQISGLNNDSQTQVHVTDNETSRVSQYEWVPQRDSQLEQEKYQSRELLDYTGDQREESGQIGSEVEITESRAPSRSATTTQLPATCDTANIGENQQSIDQTGKSNNSLNEHTISAHNTTARPLSQLAKLDLTANTHDTSGLLFPVSSRQYKSELFVGPSVGRRNNQDRGLEETQECTSPVTELTPALSTDKCITNTSTQHGCPHNHGKARYDKASGPSVRDVRSEITRPTEPPPRPPPPAPTWRQVLVSTSPTYVDCPLSTAQEKSPDGFKFVHTTNIEKDYQVRTRCVHTGEKMDTSDLPGYRAPPRSPYGTQDSGISSPSAYTTMPDPWASHPPVTPDETYTFVVDHNEKGVNNGGRLPGVYYISGDTLSHRLDLQNPQRSVRKEDYIRDVYEKRKDTKYYDPDTRTIGHVEYRPRPPGGVTDPSRAPQAPVDYGHHYNEEGQYNVHHSGRSVVNSGHTQTYEGPPFDARRDQGPNGTRGDQGPYRTSGYQNPHVINNYNQHQAAELPGRPRPRSFQDPGDPSYEAGGRDRRSWHDSRTLGQLTIGGPGYADPKRPDTGIYPRSAGGQGDRYENVVNRRPDQLQGPPPPRGPRPAPCTAQATSTALARKDNADSTESMALSDASSSMVSAVATAQATGDNPYIAVARATARAATLASANAAAGAAALPGPPTTRSSQAATDDKDISVVISTSCKIKNEVPGDTIRNSTEVIDALGRGVAFTVHEQPTPSSSDAPPGDRKRAIRQSGNHSEDRTMTLTIEGRGQDMRSHTMEYALPASMEGQSDLTSVISDAVRSILASQGATPGPHGPAFLDDTIDRVTRQVVRAYSSDMDEPPEDHQHHSDTERGGEGVRRSPPKWGETSGSGGRGTKEASARMHSSDTGRIAMQRVRPQHMSTTHTPVKQSVRPGVHPSPRSHQYAGHSERGTRPGTQPGQEDRTYFYVTGTSPAGSMAGEAGDRRVDEVLMKVVADENMQPTIEHVILSETESGSEAGTPLTRRRKIIAMETPQSDASQCVDNDITARHSGVVARRTQHAPRAPINNTSETRYSAYNNGGDVNRDRNNTRNIREYRTDTDSNSERPIRGILKGRHRHSESDSSIEGVKEKYVISEQGDEVGQASRSQQQQQPQQQHPQPSRQLGHSMTGAASTSQQPSTSEPTPLSRANPLTPSTLHQVNGSSVMRYPRGHITVPTTDNMAAPSRDKKPYESVLLRPVQDKKTPFHVIKQLEAPEPEMAENRTKIDNSRKDFLQKQEEERYSKDWLSQKHYPAPYMYDAEFEQRKRNWQNKSPNRNSNLVLVDIDIDSSKQESAKERARSCEDIKKRLGSMRLKAPPSHPADKVWPSLPLQAAKSHDRALNDLPASRKGSISSFASVNVPMQNDSVIRKVKSMNVLPGQFFSDRRSYTSLVETDIDTLDTKETPLIMETDLDQVHPSKAKSMSNLASASKWRSVSLFDDDRHKSMEALPSNYNLQAHQAQSEDVPSEQVNDENDLEREKSTSEHELRIAASLSKLSIPDWLRSSIRKNKDAVVLQNTRPRVGPEPWSSGSESGDSRPESRATKPVVIRHRVSTFSRASPSRESQSSTPDSSFELPSAKLRQKTNIDLKPIEIKKLEELSQPIDRADPKRGSAREQYLRLKAEMNSKSSTLPPRPPPKLPPKPKSPARSPNKSPVKAPLQPTSQQQYYQQKPVYQHQPKTQYQQQPYNHQPAQTKDYLETTFDGDTDSVTTQSVNSMIIRDIYETEPKSLQDKKYVAQTFIELKKSPSDEHTSDSGVFYNQTIDGPRPYRSASQSSDKSPASSLNTSMESSSSSLGFKRHHQQKPPIDTKVYTVGLEASHIVQDISKPESSIVSIDTNVDTKSPVYDNMITNLESTSKEIQERAKLISTEESMRYEYMRDVLGNRQESPKHGRKSFPVLGTKARYGPAPWQSVRKPESQIGVKMTEVSLEKSEPVIDPSQLISGSSLDEVLEGLLGLPSPSSGQKPHKESEDKLEDLFIWEDGGGGGGVGEVEEPDASPKARVFRLLKQAQTPRSSMTSVKTNPSLDNDLPQAGEEDQEEDMPLNPQLMSYASFETMDKITEEVIMVKCRNTRCKRTTELREARKNYKTCHNCYTYYCSRECRKTHWERHKRKCLFSRINSSCKHVIKRIHDDEECLEQITRIARTGYLSKGRGCVLLAFSGPDKASDFLKLGMTSLDTPIGFANINELQVSDAFGEHLPELIDMCRSYNPELKFVIEVAIVAGEESPIFPVPRRAGPAIKKCSKLRLASSQLSSPSKNKNEPETLILTAVPGSEFTENMEETKARQICFITIQRKLRQRGVSLRHHFPEVYNRLCAYVAENQHFTPMTIYPLDANTGKRFMCLIMPNSEPEVEWMYEPDLLEELGLSTSV